MKFDIVHVHFNNTEHTLFDDAYYSCHAENVICTIEYHSM